MPRFAQVKVQIGTLTPSDDPSLGCWIEHMEPFIYPSFTRLTNPVYQQTT